MKMIKQSLLPALVLGAAIAISPALRAQDAAASPKPAASAPGEGRKDPVERLTKVLDLTPDQQTKIKPILEERRTKMKALKDDTSLTADQRKAKGLEIFEASNKDIKAILTPDQVKKYDEMQEKMKERWSNKQK